MTARIAALLVIGLGLGACGGGGSSGASPSCRTSTPLITSTPPGQATVGFAYQYFITAQYWCGIGTCTDVQLGTAPAGAQLQGGSVLTWTPSAASLNSNVGFTISTYPDVCGGTATQHWTVRVYAPPVLSDFTAAPAAVRAGGHSILTATFSAGDGRISGLGVVQSGVGIDTGPLAATQTFTLSVTGAGGATLQRNLVVAALRPPVVLQFLGTTPVASGSSTRLSWGVDGDYSQLWLDPGHQALTGSYVDIIPPPGTTTYTLTAVNAAGDSSSATTTVQSLLPPNITSFTSIPATTRVGDSITLTAVFSASSGVVFDDGPSGAVTTIASSVPLGLGPALHTGGYRLIAGNGLTAVEQSLLVPMLGAGTFQATSGQPSTPNRRHHVAVRLADGRVLVAAGQSYDSGTASWVMDSDSELYDPISDTFSAGPQLPNVRNDAAAVLLRDGRVLMVGGSGPGGPVLSADIWNPATQTFSSIGMPAGVTSVSRPSAAELSDGTVLIVHGGIGAGAERFDPVTGQIQTVAFAVAGHSCLGLVVLGNGAALVVDGNTTVASELYQPSTRTFTPTATAHVSRCYQAVTLLADGNVLVSGGEVGVAAAAPAELYSPLTGSFTTISTPSDRAVPEAHATRLGDGTVLTVADTSERFDPVAGQFTRTGGVSLRRQGASVTALTDGRVLVVGGCSSDCTLEGQLRSAEIYTR